jgi:SAM-dependent methyltransferase
MTMRNHLRGIVEEVQKRVNLGVHDLVIDIGANDMTTLRFYPQEVYKLGFEPSDIQDIGGSVYNIFRIADFFKWENYLRFARTGPELDFTERKQAKVITAIGMFYDLDDPNAFLQDIKKVLAPDGLFVIEQAYLPEMLRTNNIGNVVHEHLCYYSLVTLMALLNANQFIVRDVEFSDINGGVFRVYIRHETIDEKAGWEAGDIRVSNTALQEDGFHLVTMKPYTDFIQRVFERAAKLKEFVESKSPGLKEISFVEEYPAKPKISKAEIIDIYGPSTRGLILLQLASLKPEHFRFAVDRNPDKVGKTYFGVPVVSEETMRNNPPDYALVLPYTFLNEIVGREMEMLKTGTKLIIPLPDPYILGVEML